jgi:RNA-directed DNA polymerase
LIGSSANILIVNVNPIIRGWGNYYRHCVAKKTLSTIDMHIWLKVWQWTKRKHPNSTAKYRKDRYIKTIGNRRWVFHDREKGTHLTRMNQIPIKRFIKVQKDKRVYDVKNIAYWEKRMYMNAKDSIFGSLRLTKLFRQQYGRCDYCSRDITSNHIKDGQIHQHHIKPRSIGGDWKLGNLTLLHSECHTELHGIYNRQEMADLTDKGINYVRLMKPAIT